MLLLGWNKNLQPHRPCVEEPGHACSNVEVSALQLTAQQRALKPQISGRGGTGLSRLLGDTTATAATATSGRTCGSSGLRRLGTATPARTVSSEGRSLLTGGGGDTAPPCRLLSEIPGSRIFRTTVPAHRRVDVSSRVCIERSKTAPNCLLCPWLVGEEVLFQQWGFSLHKHTEKPNRQIHCHNFFLLFCFVFFFCWFAEQQLSVVVLAVGAQRREVWVL